MLLTAAADNCTRHQLLTASTSIYGRQHLGFGDSNCTALLRTLKVVMEESNTDPQDVKQEFKFFAHFFFCDPTFHDQLQLMQYVCRSCESCTINSQFHAQLHTVQCTVAAAQFHCTAPFALHDNHNRRCWCFFRCCKSRPVINRLLRCKNAKLNVKAILLDKTHLFQY